MQNYQDVHHQITPAITMAPPINYFTCCCTFVTDMNYHVWGERVLPFMEQSTVSNEIDQRSSINSPFDTTRLGLQRFTALNSGCPCLDRCAASRPASLVVPAFLCPSTPRSQNPFVEQTQWTSYLSGTGACIPKFMAGASDYTVSSGYCGPLRNYYSAANNGVCERDRRGAMSPYDFTVSLDAITQLDGTSYTFLIVELAGRPDLWQHGMLKAASTCMPFAGGVNAGMCNVGTPLSYPPRTTIAMARKQTANWGGCWACFNNGYQGAFTGSSFDGTQLLIGAGAPVCFMNCVNVWSVGLYSFHPGACGVAMCDGSAQLLNDDINVTAFCRMLTYRGREPVPDTSQ